MIPATRGDGPRGHPVRASIEAAPIVRARGARFGCGAPGMVRPGALGNPRNTEGMPMDRLNRLVMGGGLGLILAASGCRTPKSEVPLGRPIANDPGANPPVSFSSDPASLQIVPQASRPQNV